MRTLLRRFLNDTGKDVWDDPELNVLLNLGLADVQGFIEATEPDAFQYIDRADITVNERFYPKPLGITSERELAYSSAPASVEHSKLTLATYEMIQRGEAGDLAYAHFGAYFYLSWKPPATIVDGLQVVWHPTLAMGADSDSPEVHHRLHYAIVLMAAIKALRETPDEAKSFKEDLAIEVQKIPTLYLKSAAANLPILIDMDQRW